MSKERAEPSPLRQKLAANLTRMRAGKGLSQGQLALAVGLSRNVITDIELSRVNVIQDTLDTLATFFQTTTDDLLGRRNSESHVVQLEELFQQCKGLPETQQEAVVLVLELQLRAMGAR